MAETTEAVLLTIDGPRLRYNWGLLYAERIHSLSVFGSKYNLPNGGQQQMNLLTQFPQFMAPAPGAGGPPSLMSTLDEIGRGMSPQQQMARMLDEMTRMTALIFGVWPGALALCRRIRGIHRSRFVGSWRRVAGFLPQFAGYSPVSTGFQLPYAGQSPFGSSGPSCSSAMPLNGQAGTTAFGSSVLSAIKNHCAQNPPPQRHRCYEWVAKALDRVGVHLQGGSAHMAAGQLTPNFGKSKCPESSCRVCRPAPSLFGGGKPCCDHRPRPWAHQHRRRGWQRPSDRPRKQLTNYGKSFRVFLPK